MRLFAKRSKSKEDAPSAKNKEERERKDVMSEYKSDVLVKELLKQDPDTWNAKQRRMIRRHRERYSKDDGEHVRKNKAENVTSEGSTGGIDVDTANDDEKESYGKSVNRSDENENDDIDNNNASNEDEDMNGGSSRSLEDKSESPKDVSSLHQTGDQVNFGNKVDDAKDDSTEDIASEKCESVANKTNVTSGVDESSIKELLEKLNSKERRKISRKLERNEASIKELIDEANTLFLNKKKEPEPSPNDRQLVPKVGNAKEKLKRCAGSQNETNVEFDMTNSRKRRKCRSKALEEPDWSDLPPEERLRREEQRRMQKEAAQRREQEALAGSSSRHRHPLNSERRRANRRKPKWAKRPLAKA